MVYFNAITIQFSAPKVFGETELAVQSRAKQIIELINALQRASQFEAANLHIYAHSISCHQLAYSA